MDRNLTDEQLCHLAAHGDRNAEETLVMGHTRLVRACARPFFLAGGDSEDLLQEGMLGLLAAIREYDPTKGVPFRLFAQVCIRRRIISAVRTAARDRHTPLNSYVSLELSLFVGTQDHASLSAALGRQENPEDVIIDREDLAALNRAISGQLTGLEDQVLRLYLRGSSYSEIAKEVNRSTKSVDNAVQRIRRKVARHLQSSDYSGS